MLPTPDTSHVSFRTIYEPAEDSFLLLDTLSGSQEVDFLQTRFKNTAPALLEVGTGSGVVVAFLTANSQQIFGTSIISLGVDVNIQACIATEQTARRAITDEGSKSCYLGSINADLCSNVQSKAVDILVFNPPYVPSEVLPQLPNTARIYQDNFERESHLISLSYDGGSDGMETTNRLLLDLPRVLSDRGVAYVLLCAQNKPEEIKTQLGDLPDGPWNVATVGSSGKKAGWEKLQIVRIFRDESHQNL